MKKTVLFVAAMAMSFAANATILRVSNVTGSSAPYTTFNAALGAAVDGDTIMVDASPTNYGAVEIDKRVVVIGPGFNLVRNGIVEEGANCANFDGITVKAEGVVLQGIQSTGTSTSVGGITIKAHKVVVNRCRPGKITFRDASNSIISQNYVEGGVEGYGSSAEESYIQITNNFVEGRISSLHYSYIAYNTMSGIFSLKNCTLEHNWSLKELSDGNGNSFTDNYFSSAYSKVWNNSSHTEGDVAAVEVDETLRSTYGAFAGDHPYVLSGVPAGPVVKDLIVPTTVEKGSKLQVTIKVGIQQ